MKFKATCHYTVCCSATCIYSVENSDINIDWTSHGTVQNCEDTVRKIQNKYSQKRNCAAASFPVSTFMFRWAIYIFPRSVCLFCCRKIDVQIVGIYKSLTDT